MNFAKFRRLLNLRNVKIRMKILEEFKNTKIAKLCKNYVEIFRIVNGNFADIFENFNVLD